MNEIKREEENTSSSKDKDKDRDKDKDTTNNTSNSNNKSKILKGKDLHFAKLLEKLKKTLRTTYTLIDADKIYSFLKNLSDLIQTYIKDSD
jgi:uncharacterized protein YutE (UPF0331/DUF86 family)